MQTTTSIGYLPQSMEVFSGLFSSVGGFHGTQHCADMITVASIKFSLNNSPDAVPRAILNYLLNLMATVGAVALPTLQARM